MKLIDYLGRHLKDDEVIELLESHDMEVVYHFDRLHENSPDEYWTAARGAGFQLCLDENQVVKTIFCYVEAKDGFSSVDPSLVGVPFLESASVARDVGEREGKNCKHKEGVEFLGRRLSWVSFEVSICKRHYEFSDKGLVLITLSLPGEPS